MKYEFKNIHIEPYGGNCFMYFGGLTDGNWFYVTDSWDYSFICSEDLSKYIYEEDFEQRCEDKCVRELNGDEHWEFVEQVIMEVER